MYQNFILATKFHQPTRSEDPSPVDPVKEVPTEVPRKDTRKSRVSWLRVFSDWVIRYTMWAGRFFW